MNRRTKFFLFGAFAVACSNAAPESSEVLIPAGEFVAGCQLPEDDVCDLQVHNGRERIHLPAYYIDRDVVTEAQYQVCINAGVCTPTTEPKVAGVDPKYIEVRHEQAQTYCRWLGKRLPVADEFEKAARGTNGQLYAWTTRADEDCG